LSEFAYNPLTPFIRQCALAKRVNQVRLIIAFLSRFIVFIVFWTLLSGKLDRLHFGIGVGCAAGIAFLSLFPVNKQPALKDILVFPVRILLFFIYSLWLLWKIFLAALHVSLVVLNPARPINPKFIKHKTFLRGTGAKVIFANSITLTPGTITVDISGDEFTVHQLDDDSAGDIVSGNMEKQIKKLVWGD